MLYYGIFEPQKEGGFFVEFPDVPGAFTQGNTLEEALEMAADALGTMLADGDRPEASSEVQVKKKAGTSLVYPIIASKKAMRQHGKKKRVNIVLPETLLCEIDEHVKSVSGLDRSAFLAKAASEQLHSSEAV